MFRIGLRDTKAHFRRFIMSIIAIALGVAFVVGSFCFREMLNDQVAQMMGSNSDADVYVRGATEEKQEPSGSVTSYNSTYNEISTSIIPDIENVDGVTSADEVQSATITLFDDQEGPALVFDPNQRKTVVIDLGGHTYAAWEKPVLVAYENDVTVKNGEIVFKPTPTFTTQSLILSVQIGLSFNMDLRTSRASTGRTAI